jgi:hypothetical protein
MCVSSYYYLRSTTQCHVGSIDTRQSHPVGLFPRPGCLPRHTTTALQKERLRATVRGALDHRTEADLSESAFLGTATSAGPGSAQSQNAWQPLLSANTEISSKVPPPPPQDQQQLQHNTSSNNPVDEMMELERELRAMDMALELGNSIASLDACTQQNRVKSSTSGIDGSFLVVPPGSNSFMSSSMMLGTTSPSVVVTAATVSTNSMPRNASNTSLGGGTAGARA